MNGLSRSYFQDGTEPSEQNNVRPIWGKVVLECQTLFDIHLDIKSNKTLVIYRMYVEYMYNNIKEWYVVITLYTWL